MWVIRAGKKADAHELFVKCGQVVLQQQLLGDLCKLPKSRTAFYEAYASRHPEDGRVAIGGIGGKFYRFVHEIQVGDTIIYPCYFDKNIYHGEITGDYFFDDRSQTKFPHRRQIRWRGWFPKRTLSEVAQRELGAARTLFEFKSNMSEMKRVLSTQTQRFKPA